MTVTDTESPFPAGSRTAEELRLLRDENAFLKSQKRALDDRLAAIEHDWAKVNRLLNAYATDKDWCEEYDDQLDAWNDELSRLQFSTRRKDYMVTVRVNLEYYVKVSVNSGHPDHAKSLVYDMENHEILSKIDHNEEPSDFCWEAVEAEMES
jgi:hypothetical protein